MAQLIVRNLEDEIVRALKRRAVEHGRSAEAEHREILRAALLTRARRKPLVEYLAEMPDVGDDADFDRAQDLPRDIEW